MQSARNVPGLVLKVLETLEHTTLPSGLPGPQPRLFLDEITIAIAPLLKGRHNVAAAARLEVGKLTSSCLVSSVPVNIGTSIRRKYAITPSGLRQLEELRAKQKQT
jgi:hypothetical protein